MRIVAIFMPLLVLPALLFAEETNRVRYTISRAGANEMPATAAEAIFMTERASEKHVSFTLPNIQNVKSPPRGEPNFWYVESWANYTYVADISGVFEAAQAGTVGLEVVSPQKKNFLFINGVELATTNDTLRVEKGEHTFRILTLCKREVQISAAFHGSAGAKFLRPTPEPIYKTPIAHYRFASSLEGIPSVVYNDDFISPEFHFRGNFPADFSLELAITSSPTNLCEPRTFFHISNSWARVTLPKMRVSAVTNFEWQVFCEGEKVGGGAARFVRAPFNEIPRGIKGTQLFVEDGAQLILVPKNRVNIGELSELNFRGRGKTLELGPESYDPLIRAEVLDGAFYPLAHFAGDFEGTIADAQSVIIRPRRLADETPRDFERQLAALVGIISDCLKKRVILVTPRGDRNSAAAIHRIADAYGLEVDDEFSTMR